MNDKEIIEKATDRWIKYAESYKEGSAKRMKLISAITPFRILLKEALALKEQEIKEEMLKIARLSDEEYINGMKHLQKFMIEEGLMCARRDKCNECDKVTKFISKRQREVLKI